MKLCPKCRRSPIAFVVVVFVASVSAFLTWLTLSYSELDTVKVMAGTGAVFLAVSGTLSHYVISCLKRHCRHGSGIEHQHGTAH